MKYKAKPINILQDLQVLKMIVIMLMILILKELYLRMIKNLDESLEKIYKQLNVFIKNFVILLQENIFIQIYLVELKFSLTIYIGLSVVS